jgi:hypothetical protein
LITQLVEEDGWPPEHARAIVPALLKSIADRSESDPLLKPALDKALALVGQN